jgi:hypothetical protein
MHVCNVEVSPRLYILIYPFLQVSNKPVRSFLIRTYYTVEREHKSIERDGAADEGAGSAAGRVRRTVSALASVSILCF